MNFETREEWSANFMQALLAYGKSHAEAYVLLIEAYGRNASRAGLFECSRCCALEALLKEKKCA